VASSSLEIKTGLDQVQPVARSLTGWQTRASYYVLGFPKPTYCSGSQLNPSRSPWPNTFPLKMQCLLEVASTF
jgi:hypothetical protein